MRKALLQGRNGKDVFLRATQHLQYCRLAYKSSSNFSRARGVIGRVFVFSAAKASERAGAWLVSPTKNRIKWSHFGANYLRPCRVWVISVSSVSRRFGLFARFAYAMKKKRKKKKLRSARTQNKTSFFATWLPGKSDLSKVLKWRKIKRPLQLCLWIQAITENEIEIQPAKKYTVQLKLDQNSSRHASRRHKPIIYCSFKIFPSLKRVYLQNVLIQNVFKEKVIPISPEIPKLSTYFLHEQI